MILKLKSCRKCVGDLVLDGDEWHCLQCGRYSYPHPPPNDCPPDSGKPVRLPAMAGLNGSGRRRRAGRATRDINLVISANFRSEQQWWEKNREVIRCLHEGRTVREISRMLGRAQRQVRVVKERLQDIRPYRAAEPGTS